MYDVPVPNERRQDLGLLPPAPPEHPTVPRAPTAPGVEMVALASGSVPHMLYEASDAGGIDG